MRNLKAILIGTSILLLSASVASAKTTLRFVGNADQADANFWKLIVPRYEKENPNISIKLDIISWNDYKNKFTIQMAAGSPPDICYNWPIQGFQAWMGGGMLVDMEPLMKAEKSIKIPDISPAAIDDQTYPLGGMFGMPTDMMYTCIQYNKTLFQKNGLEDPWNLYQAGKWDDTAFLEAGRRITKDTNGDGKPDIWGYSADPAGDGIYLGFLWAFGGDFLSKDRKTCMLDKPESMAAMEYLLEDMPFKYKISPGKGVDFNSGKCAMILDHESSLTIRNAGAEKYGFKIDAVMMPKFKTTSSRVSTGGYTIFQQSKNKKEAWDFIKWLNSDEIQLLKAKVTGRVPAKMSLLDDYYKAASTDFAKDNYTHLNAVLKACLPIAKPTPYTPNYNDVKDVFTKEFLTPINSGKATVKQLTPIVTKRIDTVLSRVKWRTTKKK